MLGYDVYEYYEINICGVIEVIVFVWCMGVQWIFFISFIFVYGLGEDIKLEEMFIVFESVYGWFKWLVEGIY